MQLVLILGNGGRNRLRHHQNQALRRVVGQAVSPVTYFHQGLLAIGALLCILQHGCGTRPPPVPPAVEFTQLPPSGDGSPDKLHPIAGRVKGGQPNHRIVLYARSGMWWVQPVVEQPFTPIGNDSQWKNVTHPGSAYAALLVDQQYHPLPRLVSVPRPGGDIFAVAMADGPMLAHPPRKTIHFGGYEWELRETVSDRGATRNAYDPANVWTDEHGFLHLRITRKNNEWMSAEASISRSLGFGSYRFVVRDISQLEPGAVFGIFSWDDTAPSREFNVEISRWGEPTSKNAQYVVQPYYVPANSVRFEAPPGVLTHSFRWEPGRVSFRTTRARNTELVDEHTFSSGVPAPGNESIHINLYRFDNNRYPLRQPCEVIIESFEYLP